MFQTLVGRPRLDYRYPVRIDSLEDQGRCPSVEVTYLGSVWPLLYLFTRVSHRLHLASGSREMALMR
jgi:hypothetical protein